MDGGTALVAGTVRGLSWAIAVLLAQQLEVLHPVAELQLDGRGGVYSKDNEISHSS